MLSAVVKLSAKMRNHHINLASGSVDPGEETPGPFFSAAAALRGRAPAGLLRNSAQNRA